MATSYLEQEANKERGNEIIRNDYNNDDAYSAEHKDALSDGDPNGKGTGNPWKLPTRPHESSSKTTYDYAVDTSNHTGASGKGGGGSYDIDGRDNVGGRVRSMVMNLYNEDNAYPGSLTIDESIPGQYVVKPSTKN